MNRMLIIAAVAVSITLLNLGFSFSGQRNVLNGQKNSISQENGIMAQELRKKEQFIKKSPVGINEALNLFVNLMRMLDYDGAKIEIFFTTKQEKGNLEDYFIDSAFRNVRALPVVLRTNKFLKENDLTAVLNDIYILEKQTDFKVEEITDENNVLEIKGEVYGI